MIIFDSNGRILRCNSFIEQTLDFPSDTLKGKHIQDIFEFNYYNNLSSIITDLASKKTLFLQGSFINKNGSRRPVETKISAIEYDNIPALLFISKDIWEQQTSEEKFRLLRNNLGGVIQAIANAVESRDAYTAGHQQRVADLARKIATRMGLCEDVIEGVRAAATIHDIGKIAIPSEILSKATTLLPIEFELIKRHTNIGFQIHSTIEFPWPVAAIVYQHHEKINGEGYPLGLHDDMILIESKVITVADVVEAMSTHRPYRPAVGLEKAIEEISRHSGIYYDKRVVDACVDIYSNGELFFDNNKITIENKNRRYF